MVCGCGRVGFLSHSSERVGGTSDHTLGSVLFLNINTHTHTHHSAAELLPVCERGEDMQEPQQEPQEEDGGTKVITHRLTSSVSTRNLLAISDSTSPSPEGSWNLSTVSSVPL